MLVINAKALGGEVKKYADENSAKSFEEINAVLSKHRLIKVIDMSVFGFSRGAALARAFSNRVINKCEIKDKGLLYEGYSFRQSFLGLFDTVASFGVPAHNVRLPFEERELIVSERVERCVHFVAAHEVRVFFPVDLIRKNGRLAGQWIEDVYPGVHSDVGGGYKPLEQGIDNNYARIPLRDMMREAVASGVRITPYEELRKTRFAFFTERFECRNDSELAYKSYMAALGATTGTVEDQIKRHQKLFYSANGTMHRKGMETPGDRSRDANKFKYIGPKGMAWEVSKYRTAVKVGQWVRFGGSAANSFAQYVKPADWQLRAWDKQATDGVVDFVYRFVHDSKVDFIGNLIEPFSYFKPRGVQESTVNVWTEWGNWMADKGNSAGRLSLIHI